MMGTNWLQKARKLKGLPVHPLFPAMSVCCCRRCGVKMRRQGRKPCSRVCAKCRETGDTK